jgi:hypothetical protein
MLSPMKPAKLVDTETLMDLNAVAVEVGEVSISDFGIDDLAPDGQHVGVVAGISRDGRHAIVSWALEVQSRGGRPVTQMTLPIERVENLPDAEVNDEAYTYFMNATRDFLSGVQDEAAFIREAEVEIERLTGGDDSAN